MNLLGISPSKLAPILFLFSILVAALILSNVDFLKVTNSATLPSVSEGLTEGRKGRAQPHEGMEGEDEGMEGEDEGMEGEEEGMENEDEGMEGEEEGMEHEEKKEEEVLAKVEGFDGFDFVGKAREYISARY
jgi:hypothetical protein